MGVFLFSVKQVFFFFLKYIGKKKLGSFATSKKRRNIYFLFFGELYFLYDVVLWLFFRLLSYFKMSIIGIFKKS